MYKLKRVILLWAMPILMATMSPVPGMESCVQQFVSREARISMTEQVTWFRERKDEGYATLQSHVALVLP